MPLVLALTAVTLTLTTAMALLPPLLTDVVVIEPMAITSPEAERWFLVRSQSGSWFLNGEPIAANRLTQTLTGDDPPHGGIRFLPSSGRSAEQVAVDLAWLQQVSAVPVHLQFEEGLP